jgi:protein gp37
MSANTKIEWADHTFNPWEGCVKVGPGCDHCYAEIRNARFGGGVAINWGPGAPRRRTSKANWQQPRKWNQEAKALGIRYRVFCASLADVFDNAVDPQWRADLFYLIQTTPHLDWLLLTKRIGNAAEMMEEAFRDWRTLEPKLPYPNVWLGATIVNQEEADRDIPKLLAVPARKRFLSMEPLLGPVKLPRICACGCRLPWERAVSEAMRGASALNRDQAEASVESALGIDWVIVGGESGHGARPMHPDWARSLRDQCDAAGVPFLFKQWGEWAPYDRGRTDSTQLATPGSLDEPVGWFGKKVAGRMLDGRTWDGFPS